MSHIGENWPYHEDKNGNMVPCASNPCKLHGGTDIIATSPEEAYSNKYNSKITGFIKEKIDDMRHYHFHPNLKKTAAISMTVSVALASFAVAYNISSNSASISEPVSVVQQSPGYMVRVEKSHDEFFNSKEEIRAYKEYLEHYNDSHKGTYKLETEITNAYKTKVKDKYGVVSDIVVTEKLDNGDNKSITKHILPYQAVSYTMDNDTKIPIYFDSVKAPGPYHNTVSSAKTTEEEDKRPGLPSKSEMVKNAALNSAGFIAAGAIAAAAADLIIQRKFNLGRGCYDVHGYNMPERYYNEHEQWYEEHKH